MHVHWCVLVYCDCEKQCKVTFSGYSYFLVHDTMWYLAMIIIILPLNVVTWYCWGQVQGGDIELVSEGKHWETCFILIWSNWNSRFSTPEEFLPYHAGIILITEVTNKVITDKATIKREHLRKPMKCKYWCIKLLNTDHDVFNWVLMYWVPMKWNYRCIMDQTGLPLWGNHQAGS